jgi:hypothetical protein
MISGLACLVYLFRSSYMRSSQNFNLAVESVMIVKQNSCEDMQMCHVRLRAALARMSSLGIKMVGYLLPILCESVWALLFVCLSFVCAAKLLSSAGASAESDLSSDQITMALVNFVSKTYTSSAKSKLSVENVVVVLFAESLGCTAYLCQDAQSV